MARPLPDHIALAQNLVIQDGRVHVFTDGASKFKGDRFIGGWGFYITWNGREKDMSGAEDNATVNRMELMAIYKALELLAIRNSSHQVLIYSDSAYCVNTLSVWARSWERNGWRTGSGEPVKNLELIQDIQKLLTPRVSLKWLKGHNAQPGNERADGLAVAARRALEEKLFGPIGKPGKSNGKSNTISP